MLLGDQVRENEMDGACGTQGDKKNACRDLVAKPIERDHLEDLSVDEDITFNGILKKYGMA
jgi:hypothetical protein